MNLRTSTAIVTLASAFAAAPAFADTITLYTFSGPNGATLANPTVAANTTATAITGGPNTVVGPSAGFYASAPFMIANRNNDTAANHYWQFTVTAAAGYELDLAGFNFDGARGGGSTPRSYDVRTSIGGLGLDDPSIGNGDFTYQRPGSSTATDTMPTIPFDLSGPQYQNLSSITFRVYFSTPGVSQNIDIDNVTVTGTVSPVPEPAGLGVLGLISLAALRRR